MKKTAPLIILTILLYSCKEKVNSNQTIEAAEAISLQVKNSKNYKFSQIFESAEIIPIEGETFGEITKMLAVKDKIAFITKSGNKRAFIYDLKKKILTPFVRKGNGPEEMEVISNIKINENRLILYDKIKGETREFDLNGSFLNSSRLEHSFDDIEFIEDSILVGYKGIKYEQFNKEFKLNILSKKGSDFEIDLSMFELSMHDFERNVLQANNLYQTADGKLHFNTGFSDTIYSIKPNKVIAKYILDFGKHKIDYKSYFDQKMLGREYFDKVKNSKSTWNINTLYENSDYLFFTYWIGRDIHSVFINKNIKESFGGNKFSEDIISNAQNKFQFSPDFLPAFMSEEFLYVIVHPYHLINQLNIEKIENNGMEKIQLTDNPYIIRYKFKST